MDHHVNKMTKLLNVGQNDVRIVGICGASGIGKTTIARVLYNRLHRLFHYGMFLEDVRTYHKDLVHLQKEFLSNFLKQECCDIHTVDAGINLIKDKFHNRRVLIVLDDVDQRSQLNAIAGNRCWFGDGSRIIVTSRKKYVLPTEEVAWIYEPNEMVFHESLQLLSRHAFRMNHPPWDYYVDSSAMASTLKGMPLSLKIIGSLLYGKSNAVWKDTLKQLTQNLNAEVQKKLKMNSEALDYEQQQIFVDIACLFVGFDRRIAYYMWDDCGFYPEHGIEYLSVFAFLDTVPGDNMLRMDVLVRDMGRELAKNSQRKSDRLWSVDENMVTDVTEDVEALCLGKQKYHFPDENANLDGKFEEFFSKLRWVCWLRWNCCPPEFSWTGFDVQDLVILDLSWSKISDGWEGWNHIKVARKLKVLNLTGCSCLTTTLIFSDSMFPDLERLIVEDCEELARIHPSISNLKSLLYLSVKNCAKLNELPPDLGLNEALKEIVLDGTSVQSILPKEPMKNLQILLASHCRSLAQISFTRNLESLVDVAFDFAGISELPDSIGLLVNLQNLSLNYCSSLKELPKSIGKLKGLVELNLIAAGVTNLPEDIEHLKHLRVLNLTSSSIRELPTSIGMLEKLEHLNVSCCTDFKGEIPSSIGNLYCLRILNFYGTRINNLPTSICELSRLQILDQGCENQNSSDTGITELPDSIGSLVDLQYLSLNNQRSLKLPNSIGNLESLIELNLEKIENVQLPETIARLRNLRKLNMKDCGLVEFPTELPRDLTDLTLLCTASSLRSIVSLQNLRRLCFFSPSPPPPPPLSSFLEIPRNINYCSKLEDLTLKRLNINSLPTLPPSLLELRIEKCDSLKALPDLSNLEKLELLEMENCKEVNEIEGIDKLKSLRVLRVMGCVSLEVLPDLSKCQMLLELNLRNCEKLQDIKGLDSLGSLVELDISFCISLPDVSNLKMLKMFAIKGLETLQTSALIKKDLTISKQEAQEPSTMSEASSPFPTMTAIASTSSSFATKTVIEPTSSSFATKTVIASTSSSFPTKTVIASTSSRPAKYNYQVFLSFIGEDICKNFTDDLYRSLEDAGGILTFRDNEALHEGEQIGPELREAIQQSKILIPILSKNYASSKWCLMELTHMVKCMENTKQVTLPVFYGVTPSDVKHQAGAFAEAFLQHQKVFGMEIIEEWKETLKKVAELKGLELHKFANRHGVLVNKIVSEVCKNSKKRNIGEMEKFLNIDGLLGMHHHENEMKKLLDINGSGVQIVGIYGLGGIGKTTIAKYMYGLLTGHFQQRCGFLEDVGEKVKSHNGYDDLEKQLSGIRKREASFFQYSHRKGIKYKPVLIVLDDVEERSQLNRIVGNRYRFGQGSRIIVTSRNRDVFEQHEVDQIYEPNAMSFDDSLILFCKFAFQSTHPSENYKDITRELVHAIDGVPLSLVVLGSLLFLKEKSAWEGTLKKLRSTSVQTKLKISYEALTHSEQQIFLDIACHFHGQDKRLTSYLWDDCGFSPTEGIEVLASLSLITIKVDNNIQMNDKLRELGRYIVEDENPRESGKRSRVWFHEEAVDVLNNRSGTSRVETLYINKYGYGSHRFTNDGFEGLTNLRYLHMESLELEGDFMGLLPNLRWLRWRVTESALLSAKSLTNFCLYKLVILDLSGSDLADGWESRINIKAARNLKVLNLSDCRRIRKTPDFSPFVNLERLILKGCSSLSEICSSVMHLKRLIYFNASGCDHLKKLPLEFDSMTALTEVHLDRSIDELPDSIGLLVELQCLSLNGCKSLVDLPESFWNLKSMVELDLSYTGITKLSKGIGNLKNLRKLLIFQSRIRRLPNAIGELVELENLELQLTYGIQKLPKSIGYLSNLRRLNLNGTVITTLPDSITMLAKLEILELARCELWELPESIGNLSNLRTLNLSCPRVRKLPNSITMLAKLENLQLRGCGIEELPESIGNLSNLRTLNLNDNFIKKLPDSITMLAKLEELNCSGERLDEFPNGIASLSHLRVLNLCHPDLLELPRNLRLPIGLELPLSLTTLRIPFTAASVDIVSLVNLMVLGFYSEEFAEPEENPIDMSKLCKMIELELVGFNSVKLLSTNFHTLSQLKAVRIIRYKGHERLPDLSNLQMLRELTIEDCSRMTSIGDFGQSESLMYVEIINCESLKDLPDLSGLKRLKTLHIQECGKLRVIKGLAEALSWLQYLELIRCKTLKNLPDFSNYRNLEVRID